MNGWISIGIGFIIIAITLFIMRMEWIRIEKSNKKNALEFSKLDTSSVMERLAKLENELNDVNASYYEIVSNLEGNYSVHEKQISIINEQMDKMDDKLVHIADMVKKISLTNSNYENIFASDSLVHKEVRNIQSNEQIRQTADNDLEGFDKKDKMVSAKKLYNQGWDIVDIAREINAGVAETELLLKMKN